MLTVSCGGKKIQDLDKNDEFYISNLKALVLNKKKGGAGIVLIVKLELRELINRNLPFTPVVALKMNQEWIFQDNDSSQEFKQELVKWSLMPTGMVIPLSSILEDENSNWIAVMPAYLGTAKDYMRGREKNGYLHIFSLLCQICYSLYKLHKNGFVHLDIKPTNILYKINEYETIIKSLARGAQYIPPAERIEYEFSLSDFATARVANKYIQKMHNLWSGDAFNPDKEQFGGTIPYMAPERFSSAYEAGAQADVFSLGITLVELLTGSLPFERGSMHSVVRQITSGQYYENAANLLAFNKINKRVSKCVLNLIQYDQEARRDPMQIMGEYYSALENISKTFFSTCNLNYRQTQNYVKSSVAFEDEGIENNVSQNITDEEVTLSVSLVFRDAFRKALDSGFEEKNLNQLKEALGLTDEAFKKSFDLAALFEIERISHEVNALKKTGFTYTKILEILKQKLPKIEKWLLPAKTEDANSFSFVASHFVVPKIVERRPNDISSLWTSVFPFSTYLYFNVLALYSVIPDAGHLPKTKCYHDWLNSQMYYYMIQFSNISDDLRQRVYKERDMASIVFDPSEEGRSILGCHYSIVLFDTTTNQYHCIAIGNSPFGLEVRTSHEWARVTKRYYKSTIPTTDCEMPFFQEGYGEAKMSEKECLAPENILKFLKDNVTKISES